MQISTRTTNDISIVAIAGSLDSSTSPEAQKSLAQVLTSAKKVVLDFSALDYISSAGLRVLLGAAKQLRASGGTLGLFGLNPSVREVFEISGFSSILSVYPSESDALGAIFGERNGVGQFVRSSVELWRPAYLAQQIAELRMKGRDRHRAEREGSPAPVDSRSNNLIS